ncbi:MAG: hypothetical protein EOS01_26745 [Mesorhizobium sp.]|nr:MAG: hypothetical protein EOS01_26745 [Mesorhizobium sp.]
MIGSRVRLTGTDIDGLVVGKRSYLGEMDRYAVRYLDGAGAPQERWFQAGEVSFEGREAEGNVISFEREVA